MSTERTGGISIVGEGEEVITGDEMVRRDRVGNIEPLGGGVCSGSQSLTHSMGKKRQEVHPRVVTLDERVLGDEE